MDLEYWATTDVGRVRDHNEDNFLVDRGLSLFVVCDGMGGHAAGEVASAMSVKIVREVLRSHREVFERLEQDPDSLANRKSVLTLIEHAITEACARIYHAAQEDLSKKGMGTTCSLLLLAQGRGFIGHVGDSRIYLHRQEAIHQITEDHSLVNEMIRLGKIKRGEEHNLPHKNAVTRAVGVNEFVEVDTWELDVFSGDSFLLCSDGLSGYFKDDSQIVSLVAQDDVKKITQDCIDFANAGGGKDNITAILVRVRGAQKQDDLERKLEVIRATPYFQYLKYKELVQIVNLSETRHFDADEAIFAQGADPGCMFFVVEGSVALERAGATVAKLAPGDHFGEMAMIDETPQELAAVAGADTEVLAFRRDRFMELLRSEPNLAVKLLWNFLQIWTIRLRKVSYADVRADKALDAGPTPPPSRRMSFEEDRRGGHQPATVSGEFEAATRDVIDEPDATVRGKSLGAEQDKAARAAAAVKAEPATIPPRSEARTVPAKPAHREALRATIDPDKTVPDTGLGALAWEDIIPPDLLEDEASLRRTVQMDRDTVDPTGPMEAEEDLRKTIPSSDFALGRAVKGESTTRSITPQAQVLKRTKLVVSGDGEFDARESTRDVQPITRPGAKSDSTLELDIEDDGVEEVP